MVRVASDTGMAAPREFLETLVFVIRQPNG